ncbi:UNVERIFIED_CONTAM: hypothetical protein Sindi_0456400 [Sesamum indicum]
MVIKLDIANFAVHKVLIDNGSSADIILKEVLSKMGLDNVKLAPVKTPLVGFGGSEVESLGTIDLPVSIGEEPRRKTLMAKFLVVDTPFAYNVILGRPEFNFFRAIVSTYHLKMKFPTPNGIGEVSCDQAEARRCYNLSLKKGEAYKRRKIEEPSEQWESRKVEREVERIEPIDKHKEIELARYILEVQYTDWLSNVVVVPKSSEKWRMCTDFTDFNKACPKDPYPLPRIDVSFTIIREYGMKHNPSRCTFGVGGGRGIKANPEKFEAILQLKSPASVKDVQKLTGKIASLNRFISRSADRNLHFFKILRKAKEFKSTEECEQAFQELKKYFRTPPLLANPKAGDTLYLYLVVSENAVSSVLVREDKRKQNPVYYVSKMLQGVEKRYTSTEKLVLALVVAARKLRPYFQSYKLGEYDIDYQARIAEKAQVIADFVMELSGESTPEQNTWMLHVDGSRKASNGGAGIMIQGPERVEIEIAAKLSFSTTNNNAKYEALIMGLELAHEAGARALEPAILVGDEVNKVEAPCPWKDEITKYLQDGTLPGNATQARKLKFRVTRFTLIGSQLYKRSIEGPLLKCLDDDQAKYVMREVHEGSCGNHSGARSLAQKLTRQGYFWPTVLRDTKEFVQRCESCQKYASQIHAPRAPMQPIKVTCPFDQWGIDILGLFPPGKAQKKFIVVAVEYFSKWIEAEADFDIRQWDAIAGKTNNSLVERTKGSAKHQSGRLSPRERVDRKIGEETQGVATYDPGTNGEARTFNLITVDEKRKKAYVKMLHHKGLMMRNSNKKLQKRELQVGYLVMKRVEVSKHVGKLDPGWEGPYKVVKIKKQGMYKLQDTNGKHLQRPWNIQNLRKFYA